MRILFVTVWYPTADAPYSYTFVNLHARAAEIDNKVLVLHLQREGDHGATGSAPGTIAIATPRVVGHATRRRWLHPATTWRNEVRAIRATARSFGADLIHAHMLESVPPAVLAGRSLGLPVVATEHYSGFPLRALTLGQRLKARHLLSRVDLLLPVSASLGAAISTHRVTAPQRIVSNAVDSDIFSPQPDASTSHRKGELRAISVSRLHESKDIPNLLQAFANLSQPWALEIVGDGALAGSLNQLARRLGIADRVTWLGVQPHNAIAERLALADVFVMASAWESQPVVILEALCVGVPVVATKVGGIPEIVTDEDGLLVPPSDPEALTCALTRVASGGWEPDRQAIASRAVSRFSLPVVGSQLTSAYEEALHNFRRRERR